MPDVSAASGVILIIHGNGDRLITRLAAPPPDFPVHREIEMMQERWTKAAARKLGELKETSPTRRGDLVDGRFRRFHARRQEGCPASTAGTAFAAGGLLW